MLHLITATPGSGKTFWAVSEMLKLAQAGETIYSNINGCTIPDILPLPDDYDIEGLPDNSYVFIDEAQKIDKFQAVGRQPLSSDPTVKFFEVHRHRGFEIFFITQDPEFLHKHILKLIGHHVFLVRPMGSRFPAVYEWSKYQNRPDSKAAQKSADAHSQISFKKSVYQYYQSTVKDTHKFQWKKLLKLAALPIIGLIGLIYIIFFSNNHFLNKDAIADTDQAAKDQAAQLTGASGSNPTINPASPPVAPTQTAYDQESKRVSFISKSSDYCRAFDGNGNLMRNLPYSECIFLSENPIAINAANPENIKQLNKANYIGQQSNDYSANGKPLYAQNTTSVRGDPLPF